MVANYLMFETRRLMRDRRTLIFGLAMPVVLLLVFAGSSGDDTLGGLKVATYLTVSMATFGAMGGVFSSGGRIAVERGLGWNRQLRLTALSSRDYVISKALTGYAVAIPSIVLIGLVGALAEHVSLAPGRWAGAAVSMLVCLVPIAILGILIGYLARPESMQAISGIMYSLLALLGGVWVPVETMPGWMRDVVETLPPYWIAHAGRAAVEGHWIGWRGLGTVVAWTLVLGALAARAYRRESDRAV
jgi:ABC-2 type transport system permease protein